MTTLPGEPAIAKPSNQRSFNIMSKEPFKKIMKDGFFYPEQKTITGRQTESSPSLCHYGT
jgi:hypothetical protein